MSDLSDYSVRLAARPGDDPDLEAMAREAAEGAAEPGRVICSADRSRFTLFLPDTVSTPEAPAEPRVRGFLIDMDVFRRIHQTFNADNRLTEAEQRVAFQLVAGISLREAAALDRVGVETKRSQTKSATAKMQCSGQTDLVRLLTAQLSIVRSLADDEARHAPAAEAFVAAYLGPGVRLSVERLPTGRALRVIEAGPADGQPVVVLHGMMFGMLLAGVAPVLQAQGLRLLVPLRHGYLDPRPVLDLRGTDRLIAKSLADLALFIEARGLGPVTLLGQSLGAVLALDFAARSPAQVGRLILLSANTAGSDARRDSFTDRLYGGYRRLGQGQRLSRAITMEFSRHYPDPGASRAILDRMFGASAADMAAMDGHALPPPVTEWFPPLYRQSVAGISEDYDLVMARGPADALPMPCLVLHGSDDPLTPLAEMRALARCLPAARLEEIPGAGHFASASHPQEVWGAVAAFLREGAGP